MRKIFCFRFFYITVPFIFQCAQAQSDHFAFAVTASKKGGTEWIAFRKIDTRSGDFSNILMSLPEKNQDLINRSAYQVNAIKDISRTAKNAQFAVSQQPFTVMGNSVAAIAYDGKRNRLYFTPMSSDQLRYIDLSTMQINNDLDQYFSLAGKYDFNYSGPINRLVIAPDDYGYTITTDGDHLIRFTTDETPRLTDLGQLIDDPLNKDMSIHNPCSTAGGDIIADDAGHLYLICASNKVFKIDISSRLTTYLTTISELPARFTTSGAAVSDDGKIIVSSVLYSDAYFIVDPETWSASPSPAGREIYGSADLASSNALHEKSTTRSSLFWNKSKENHSKIRVFPNPLMFDRVSVQFNDLPPGNYIIQLSDLFGQKVLEQKSAISGNNQIETLQIPHFTAQGFYYVRVLNESKSVISIQKLVVERW